MRKVVLLHQTGPYTGLYQILGTDADVPSLPSVVEGVTFLDGRLGSATLAYVTDRYALYREVQ